MQGVIGSKKRRDFYEEIHKKRVEEIPKKEGGKERERERELELIEKWVLSEQNSVVMLCEEEEEDYKVWKKRLNDSSFMGTRASIIIYNCEAEA